MAHERRGDRRPPSRPTGGGGFQDRRPYRQGGRPPGGDREPGRYGGAERGGMERGGMERGGMERGGARPPYRPHVQDEGGMAMRVDPRRLGLLKELAAAEGLRPGQLVQRWVEERLDAEREGRPAATPEGAARLAALEASVASLAARLDAMAQGSPAPATVAPSTVAPVQEGPAAPAPEAGETRPRRRGRPPKAAVAGSGERLGAAASPPASGERVPLHEEIIAVITERGPSTAAEIADAIRDRGRYHAPRSSRALDAATVNSRVSNPVYRARFVRSGRRIGLAG